MTFAFEDPFDTPTSNIPERLVTIVEGDLYSVIVLVGLGMVEVVGYTACKEFLKSEIVSYYILKQYFMLNFWFEGLPCVMDFTC